VDLILAKVLPELLVNSNNGAAGVGDVKSTK
jgi:hypothetical protein